MRDLLFMATMILLLPLAAVRPMVGVLLWSWISFMNPHQLVWGMSSDIPWALMIVCVTLLGCVLAREPKHPAFNSLTILIIAFLLCISLTSLTALAPADQVEAKWLTVFKTFLFLLITAHLLTDKTRVTALLWVMVISLGYFGVRGGGFALLTAGADRVYGPPNTMITDNNHLAAALLVTMPLMNYLRLQARHRVVRLGLLVGMGLTLFAVLGSYSRGALIGLGAMTLFLWWNGRNKLVSGMIMAIVVAGAISFMPQTWSSRMSTISTASENDASAEGRLTMWRESFIMAVDRPLTGAGFMGPYNKSVVDQFVGDGQARAVHSIYFEVIGEHGFPTFVIWLSMTLVSVLNTMAILRESRGRPDLAWSRDFAKMAQVSIIAYLVAGAFLSLCYWDFYFTLLVAIAATRQIVRLAVRQPQQAAMARTSVSQRFATAREALSATPKGGARG
jgi:probable O-glycosylation ligase (exosortase A-associated)